ncbi:DNA primase [Lactobacillus sp. ESL0791]|uniref:DNA primase n=1 Tax=Lactobacillus sp. ESL0791 TaxID=2983234 RepID=UPI0023F8A906|nr:DNA primase [Lactobacillus sp. ESL0791]MDF7638960.1 DNA primase [Lactobacillus sp. ESL0791]
MAGLIPEDFINKVRSNVNIVDVISQYVSLEKKGKDYTGLCPFHQEKTPSFTVNEDKQFFKCFGCGKGGNVFKFLMYKENLTFPESVQRAAEFAHIEMDASFTQKNPVANSMIRLHQDAVKFYQRVLTTTNAGQRGLKYARKRGLSDELLEHFQIGYAPRQDNLLLMYLQQKKYTEEDLVKSGLFVESKDGRLFDRFRDRLMFPLGNESGYVIGFSGRRLSDDKTIAKYVNSPETELFTKSKVLFHFAEAKKAARSEGHLVLYEGYMDVIAAYKAGIRSGIASMGTSLTDQQVYMLKRITNNIIINYDGDDPGVHAEERAAQMFEQTGSFNLGIVVLPEKLDPDEYVKKYGAEKYQDEVKGAYTATDFFLKRLEQKYNLDNDREKILYLDEAIKQIAKLPNPVEQDLYLDKVANEQNVSRDSLKVNLTRQIRRLRTAAQHKNRNPYPEPELEDTSIPVVDKETEKNDPVQTRLLYLFIHSEHARDYLLEKKFLFPDQDYAQLAELWLKFIESHEDQSINSFLDFIPEQLQGIIVSAEMINMPKDYSEREIDEQVRALQMRKIDSQIDELMRNLQDAKRKDDNDTIINITRKILQLKRTQGQKGAF